MNTRLFTLPLLILCSTVAVFGLYLTLAAPLEHDMGCPFMPGEAVLCESALLAHMTHWQTALAAVIAETFLLFALARLVRPKLSLLPECHFEKAHTGKRKLKYPTLFQVLFSQGILNPKAP